jgi:hypothetical protein
MTKEVVSGLESALVTVLRRPDGTQVRRTIAYLRDFNWTRNNESYARRDVGRSNAIARYKGTNTVSGSFSVDSNLTLSPYMNSQTANYITNGDAALKIGDAAVSWTQTANVTIDSLNGYNEDTQAWEAGAGNSWIILDSANDDYEEISQTCNIPLVLPTVHDSSAYEDSIFKSLNCRFSYVHVSGVTTIKLTGINVKSGAEVALNSVVLETPETAVYSMPVDTGTLATNNIEQITFTVTTRYDNTGAVDLTNTAQTRITNISLGESTVPRFADRTKTLNLDDMLYIVYDMERSDGSTASFLFAGVEITSLSGADSQDINSESVSFTAMDMFHLDQDSSAYGLFHYGDDDYYGDAIPGGA